MFHDFYVRIVMCFRPHWLQYLKHQTLEDCRRAILSDPTTIQHARFTGTEYDELCLLAYRFIGCYDTVLAMQLWPLLRNPSTRTIAHIVIHHPEIYPLVDKTEDLHYEMIIRDPLFIRLIDKPSEFICQKAVSGNSEAIMYLNCPSEMVCLTAVANNGLALRFIRNPSKKVCMKALEYGPACAWQYIDDLDVNMVVQALTSWEGCYCGCMSTIPKDLLEEALPMAIQKDPDVLDLCTTQDDIIEYYGPSLRDLWPSYDARPLFQLSEEAYVALAIIGSTSHGLELILRRVHDDRLRDIIEKVHGSRAPKNAQSVNF